VIVFEETIATISAFIAAAEDHNLDGRMPRFRPEL